MKILSPSNFSLQHLKFFPVLITIFFGSFSTCHSQQANIYFKIDMNNQIKIKNFIPDRGDIVIVRGSFNNWKGNEFQLSDFNHNGIYSGGFQIYSKTIEYKYVIVPGDKRSLMNEGWEAIENRKANVPNTQTGDTTFFNNIEKVFPFNIVLKLDMSNQIVQNNFYPESPRYDEVVVRGNFNSWYLNENKLVEKDKNNIYEINLSGYSPTKQLVYKFAIISQKNRSIGNNGWEQITNRIIPIGKPIDEVPVAFFNNQKNIVVFRVKIKKTSKYYNQLTHLDYKLAIKLMLNGLENMSEPMIKDSTDGSYSLGLSFENKQGILNYSYCILSEANVNPVTETKIQKITLSESGIKLPIIELDK